MVFPRSNDKHHHEIKNHVYNNWDDRYKRIRKLDTCIGNNQNKEDGNQNWIDRMHKDMGSHKHGFNKTLIRTDESNRSKES